MRWFFGIFLVLILVLSFIPTLKRWGLGRLPGDLHFQVGKHHIEIPLMSTILLALIVMVMGRLL